MRPFIVKLPSTLVGTWLLSSAIWLQAFRSCVVSGGIYWRLAVSRMIQEKAHGVLGHSLVRSLVRSHRSLVHLWESFFCMKRARRSHTNTTHCAAPRPTGAQRNLETNKKLKWVLLFLLTPTSAFINKTYHWVLLQGYLWKESNSRILPSQFFSPFAWKFNFFWFLPVIFPHLRLPVRDPLTPPPLILTKMLSLGGLAVMSTEKKPAKAISDSLLPPSSCNIEP